MDPLPFRGPPLGVQLLLVSTFLLVASRACVQAGRGADRSQGGGGEVQWRPTNLGARARWLAGPGRHPESTTFFSGALDRLLAAQSSFVCKDGSAWLNIRIIRIRICLKYKYKYLYSYSYSI